MLPVQGPLTLAASLYLARGDRALSDEGAVRELTESFAAGLAEELGRVRVAVPGAEPVVLLHEPMLAAVLVGAVPTFSGYSAIRRVPGAVVSERLRTLATTVREAGATRVVVHLGDAWVAVPTVRVRGRRRRRARGAPGPRRAGVGAARGGGRGRPARVGGPAARSRRRSAPARTCAARPRPCCAPGAASGCRSTGCATSSWWPVRRRPRPTRRGASLADVVRAAEVVAERAEGA